MKPDLEEDFKLVGIAAGAATGAIIGAKIGWVGGPLGSGTCAAAGAAVGGMIGYIGGRELPKGIESACTFVKRTWRCWWGDESSGPDSNPIPT